MPGDGADWAPAAAAAAALDDVLLAGAGVQPAGCPRSVGGKRRRVRDDEEGCGAHAAGHADPVSERAAAATAAGVDAAGRYCPLPEDAELGSSTDESSYDSSCPEWEGRTVGAGRFEVLERVGQGSYADCFRARDLHARDGQASLVCLKIEDKDQVRSKLKGEWAWLEALAKPAPHRHDDRDGDAAERLSRRTPRPVLYLPLGRFDIVAIELLGPSLEDLFQDARRRFSARCVAAIGPQVINCLEAVHIRGILHRDIKPSNFLVGRGETASRVFVVDFGLSRRYLQDDGRHVAFRKGRGPTGTARYMSVVAHGGHEQGRRDDIESVGHMLLYFLRGSLPWQKLRSGRWADRKKKHAAFHEAKLGVSLAELCRGLPHQMLEYMEYARALPFDAAPDYPRLRRLLASVGDGEGSPGFDWSPSLRL